MSEDANIINGSLSYADALLVRHEIDDPVALEVKRLADRLGVAPASDAAVMYRGHVDGELVSYDLFALIHAFLDRLETTSG